MELSLFPPRRTFRPGKETGVSLPCGGGCGSLADPGRTRVAAGHTVLELPPLPLLFLGPEGGAAGRLLEGTVALAAEAREFGGRLLFFPEGGVHPLLRQGGLIELRMRTGSGRFPGVEVEKRIRLGRGPVREISYALTNRGRGPAEVSLRISHWDLPGIPVRIAYMGLEGLIRDVLAGFPEGKGDFPEKLPEGWPAFELPDEGRVIGLVPQGEMEWDCE